MLESVSGGENKDEIKKNEHKIKKELGKVVDIKEELKQCLFFSDNEIPKYLLMLFDIVSKNYVNI